MRVLLLLHALLLSLLSPASVCRLTVEATDYRGKTALLYKYDDLVTDRLVLLVLQPLDVAGRAAFTVEVADVAKALLRIGDVGAEFFLVPGASYDMEFPSPGPTTAHSIGGTMRVDPVFNGLDRFDINALVSDLNLRLDDFLAEGLATDEDAGMHAAEDLRTAPKDSLQRPDHPPDISVMPAPSQQRIDTFELKLRKFYADAKDPWFWHYLEYSVAGLRFSPRSDPRMLFERYINGRPVVYDDPEQMRFLQNFFAEHLMVQVFRTEGERLQALVKSASADSVMALLGEQDLLRDDARLRELVMIDQFYADYHTKRFDRKGIEAILARVRDGSSYPEHRIIAANILWDLTAMRSGSTFPSLALRDLDGKTTQVDDLLQGAVCIAITAGWCTLCEVEMQALEQLHKEYGGIVRFITIGLDSTWGDFDRYARSHDAGDRVWLYAGDDPVFMDELRIHSVPAFFLLNDRVIAHAPASLPSQGMAEIFFKLKTEAEQRNRIRFDEPPPPKRTDR